MSQFFLEPVTDAIAPGYSSIITQPMCFVAMREKIQQAAYSSLQEYEVSCVLLNFFNIRYLISPLIVQIRFSELPPKFKS